MIHKKWKWSSLILILFAAVFITGSWSVMANPPGVSMGTIQVEDYYDKLREAFYQGTYDEVGACNGWVERVINKSGLIGELKVDGTTVLELNDALKNSDYCTLVASREGGQSDYQEATDQMIEDVNAGKIKAGDILIFTKNMNDPDHTPNPHWLHAAIMMKETFDGKVDNYFDYALTRWKLEYIGYPTMAHALAEMFGVEYYTPLTSPSSLEGEDDGSTGYYVYRLEPKKYEEAQKKLAEEKKAKKEKKETKTEAPKQTQPATPATTAANTSVTEETGENSVSAETQNQGGVSKGSNLGAIFSLLIAILTVLLLFFCVLIL